MVYQTDSGKKYAGPVCQFGRFFRDRPTILRNWLWRWYNIGEAARAKAFARHQIRYIVNREAHPQVKSGRTGKSKPQPVIDPLECKGCGRCVIACPAHALQAGARLNERGYRYVEYGGEGCTGCGACYYTCPEPNALKVRIPLKEKKEDHLG